MSYNISMPNIHNVTKLEAKMDNSGDTVWFSLTLYCQTKYDLLPETFNFTIFPTVGARENFHRLATHINEIFAPAPVDPYDAPEYGEENHMDLEADAAAYAEDTAELEYLADKAREEGTAA